MKVLAFVFAFGIVAAICAITGVAQWLVLRRYLKRSAWWVLATFAGWVIGLVLVIGAVALLGAIAATGDWFDAGALTSLGTLLLGPLFGVVLGGFQALALRKQVPHAGRWVGATVAGMTIGFLPSALLNLARNLGIVHSQIPSLLTMMLFGALYGWITGKAMLGLLRKDDNL